MYGTSGSPRTPHDTTEGGALQQDPDRGIPLCPRMAARTPTRRSARSLERALPTITGPTAPSVTVHRLPSSTPASPTCWPHAARGLAVSERGRARIFNSLLRPAARIPILSTRLSGPAGTVAPRVQDPGGARAAVVRASRQRPWVRVSSVWRIRPQQCSTRAAWLILFSGISRCESVRRRRGYMLLL